MDKVEKQPSPESIERLQQELRLCKTVIEITKSISCVLDLEQLLTTVIDLIRDYFVYDYIQIYLLDNARKWAVIRAGTGEVGRVLLRYEYKVEISNSTLIGKCVQNCATQIEVDGDITEVSFRNPLLPDMNSAIALPLISRDKIIGVLEVQDGRREAFFDEDVLGFQLMADHIAIAIDNARLFGELQEKRM